jgi:hypothetical protein
MNIVDEMALAFMVLIRSGSVLRIIYCFITMAGDDEQAATYKKRIKNTIMFYIMAESVYVIRDLALHYYS